VKALKNYGHPNRSDARASSFENTATVRIPSSAAAREADSGSFPGRRILPQKSASRIVGCKRAFIVR
jgi:hypothetical protein